MPRAFTAHSIIHSIRTNIGSSITATTIVGNGQTAVGRSAVRRHATAQADFWGGKPIALTCRDHPSPCDFRIKSLQTPRCVSVAAGLVISLRRSLPVAPMASEIADAALAARLDRIKELTSELARMQADSVEARLLAERIQREIERYWGRPSH